MPEQQSLRDQIERLVANALQADLNHVAAMAATREVHASDMLALADIVDMDAEKLGEALNEIDQLKRALATRDVIGQAKGIMVATLGCSSDKALTLLIRQSTVRKPQSQRDRIGDRSTGATSERRTQSAPHRRAVVAVGPRTRATTALGPTRRMRTRPSTK